MDVRELCGSRVLRVLLVGLALCALGAAPAAAEDAQAALPSDPVTISSITYQGDGCPAGTAGTAIREDLQSAEIIYDQFLVRAGSAVSDSARKSSCRVTLTVQTPTGWSWAASLRQAGYVLAPPNVTARTTVRLGTTGGGSGAPIGTDSFAGPRDEDYLVQYDTEPRRSGGTCGGPSSATFTTEIGFVGNPRPDGVMSVDNSKFAIVGVPC
ncbi:DUF4360 domain-containing protein [Actinomycetospora lutea]|uniref:DUF4360 domain-containing protein n=1 Tax=Actinomycetospora lutea TaxID=663604 RepID=UPI0023672FB6|nr:DUF4360 domain-containing protein [Actinomycetospora lutea]MDD7940626.1 DUF4360 domain-containing protein [Actinomycetospora lutea]